MIVAGARHAASLTLRQRAEAATGEGTCPCAPRSFWAPVTVDFRGQGAGMPSIVTETIRLRERVERA